MKSKLGKRKRNKEDDIQSARKKLKIVKLDPSAILPTRKTDGSAGYDINSTIDMIIEPNCRKEIKTGLIIEIKKGYYCKIHPRSGLAVNDGINVGGGVIDSDYRGEIKVILFNHDPIKPFVIKKKDRIAQIIFQKYEEFDLEETNMESLSKTERGSNGFGSTGV